MAHPPTDPSVTVETADMGTVVAEMVGVVGATGEAAIDAF
jgi:hypothetical protein